MGILKPALPSVVRVLAYSDGISEGSFCSCRASLLGAGNSQLLQKNGQLSTVNGLAEQGELGLQEGALNGQAEEVTVTDDPVLRNKRSHRNEKPAHRNEE
ncbi:hypothetical protein J1605_017470 [Eschrichtius robustus]|uniref:Uncharacterized protein n=1 Tax=Eschrichtius robustus TaxID=9764 RepID=A0AB34I1Y9_ESCRO|nr:hypothetical protein J1605_017470 [Eschrichtius robustus]